MHLSLPVGHFCGRISALPECEGQTPGWSGGIYRVVFVQRQLPHCLAQIVTLRKWCLN